MKIKIFNYTIKISKNRGKYKQNLIREASKKWSPPSALDAPRPRKGFMYRWIRAEILAVGRGKKITGKLREGFELVKPNKYEAKKYPIVDEGRYKGCIGVGGLVLAKIPIKKIERLGI